MYNNPNTTYTSEKKRPFRVSSIGKIPDTEKMEWVDKKPNPKYHWEVVIKFLDSKSPQVLKLKYDHNDKIYETEKIR